MSSEFDLADLRSFINVADRRSILGAAEALSTSRARVRRHLENIEGVLGVQLMVRTREGVELTRDGEEFLEQARQIVGDVRTLTLSYRERGDQPQGHLRIGLQVGYPVGMALIIAEFVRQKLPDTRTEHVIAERPAELLPDRVDAAVGFGEQTPPVPCVEIELTRTRQSLFARKDYLEKLDTAPTLEFVQENLLGVWRGPADGAPYLHRMDGEDVEVSPPFVTSDEQFLKAMALKKDGFVYAPLPPSLVDLDMAKLAPGLQDEIGRSVRGRLMVPESLELSPRIKVFVDAVRQLQADASQWDH